MGASAHPPLPALNAAALAPAVIARVERALERDGKASLLPGEWQALSAAREVAARRSGLMSDPANFVSHASGATPLSFAYTNWKGAQSRRRVLPCRLYFGATDWHPEPQWLLEALDLDKNALRVFAVRDMVPESPGDGRP